MNSFQDHPISRRDALRWVIAASGTVAQLRDSAFAAQAASGDAKPYGTDPLLNRVYKPGDFWPLTLDAAQRKTVAALADVILPEDDRSPAASAVGVTAFIDEWISAPYTDQQRDRAIVLEGLRWLDEEAQRRFQQNFAALSAEQKSRIADDICYLPKAAEGMKGAAKFFSTFRTLTMGGYYTSKEGTKDIGYIGNAPQTQWAGAPASLVKQLGLAG